MSSGFVTEEEIEVKRKQRQEEWERVRKDDQPKDAPEEPYDGRWLRVDNSNQAWVNICVFLGGNVIGSLYVQYVQGI